MRKYSSLFWYVALFLISILVDRATKFFSLRLFGPSLNSGFSAQGAAFSKVTPYKINSYLKFELLFNRGISWGMFDSKSSLVFFFVSFFIFLITVVVALYAYQRYKQGHMIIGEVLVVAGSLSNIVDRIVYGGVIDFISLSYGAYAWPVFNIADVCIVVGAFVMMLGIWSKK